MERVRIEKRTLGIIVTLAILSFVIFEVSTAPKIICKIECSTCPGGVMEQDFTKEAKSLKGREAEIMTQNQKLLKFKDCYALKRKFFSPRYFRSYELNWNSWF